MKPGDLLAETIRLECQPGECGYLSCCLVGVQWGGIAHRLAQDGISVLGVDDWGKDRARLQRAAVTPYDLLEDETCEEARLAAVAAFGEMREGVAASLWRGFPYDGPRDDLGKFDCLWLDYDYSAQGTYQLAMLWLPVLKPGGMLAGRKYYDRRGGKGVRAGVDALAKRLGLQIQHAERRLWWGKVACPQSQSPSKTRSKALASLSAGSPRGS